MKFYKTIFILASIVFSTSASALDFYVSPLGNDQANGLAMKANQSGTAGPFKTLAQAQLAVRNIIAGGQLTGPVTVHIALGTYQLGAPLTFDSRDSGTASSPITWQAVKGGTFISGGIPLLNCKLLINGQWNCPVSGLGLDKIKYNNTYRKKGTLPGFNLFVNQNRLNIARWPDSGWMHIKTPLDASTTFTTFEPVPNFYGSVSQAQVHIFANNDWYDEYLPVLSLDSRHNEVKLSMATAYPLASGRRFYLLNILSALTTYEEWFYDSANARVLFIPEKATVPSNVVVSALQNLITLNGAGYLNFENMTFQYSTDVAVSVNNSNNVLFDGIEISNVDATGLVAINNTNFTLSNSVIHDTGEEGIYLSSGNRNTLQAANNIVHNNHIYNFGMIVLTYSPAVDANGVGIQITNNFIEQGAGTGVLMTGNNHLFAKNEVSNVCQQASDCGALYTGRDWTARGNNVLNNSFHDIHGYGLQTVDVANNIVTYSSPNGARGVYLDDALSSFNIIGNIFNNAGLMAVQIGGGRNNIIQNNVFYTNSYAIYTDDRWPTYDWTANIQTLAAVPYQGPVWKAAYPALALPMNNYKWPEGNVIQRNVIISSHPSGLALQYTLPNESTTISNNLVWGLHGNFSVAYTILDMSNLNGTVSWHNWMSLGIEKNSINANPCATITGNTVTFCNASPINLIGFQPLPGGIGLTH